MQFIVEIWLVIVVVLVIGLFWCAIASNRHRKEVCPKCGSEHIGYGSYLSNFYLYAKGLEKAKYKSYIHCYNCNYTGEPRHNLGWIQRFKNCFK